MAQSQWQADQPGRAALELRPPPLQVLTSRSGVAWLPCRARPGCQKPAVVTEREGKGAARALDAGAFKARLLVDVSRVSAAVPVLVAAWGRYLCPGPTAVPALLLRSYPDTRSL